MLKSYARLRCLLVDDDPSTLSILKHHLLALGISTIDLCHHAHSAIEKLQTHHRYDIVFSDINMPEGDGIDLVRHIYQYKLCCALIFVSGEERSIIDSIGHMATERGLQYLGAITKPISSTTLQQLLATYSPDFNYKADIDLPKVSISDLRQAIDQKEIEAYFQPQVCARTGELIGAEALAYWQHPSKGLISPTQFIPLAESHGFIHHIAHSIFSFCCSHLQHWQANGIDISLSINLSPLHLYRLDLPDIFCDLTKSHGVQPQNLIIELTESGILEDTTTSIDILSRFRLRGFQLSIDDYGTGYSSLEKLQHIPFTELKIDRSFVKNARINKASQGILEATVNLAKKLNLKCVAEGVELESDWQVIQRLQCDVVQGFFISRPMPANDFFKWAKERSTKVEPRGRLSTR